MDSLQRLEQFPRERFAGWDDLLVAEEGHCIPGEHLRDAVTRYER